VSTAEEVKIGNGIHGRMMKNRIAKNVEGTPIQLYLNDVGAVVADNVKRTQIPYKFHIIDSSIPNAFASCGGQVYVTIGLLERLQSEAELASILGHEITHIDAKHAIGRIQHKISNGRIEDYVDFGFSVVFQNSYSEAQEEEADLGGVYLAYKAGYHPMAVVNAFQNINSYEFKNRNRTKAITPLDETINATFGLVGRYFATHPLSPERVDKIKNYINVENFIEDHTRLYVGQRNLKEKVSFKESKYKEEFQNEYVIEKETEEKATLEDKMDEELVNEVYTTFGTISEGMSLEEIKKLLPEKNIAFEHDDRVGYKNIDIYQTQIDNLKEQVGLWIELEAGKVSGIKLYRRKKKIRP